MEKTKVTKKMVATAIQTFLDNEDIMNLAEDGNIATVNGVEITLDDALAYLAREIELLSKKKSSGNSKKTQEVEAIKAEVLEALGGVEKVTVTELTVLLDNKYSGQKLNPILKKLAEEGKVERTTEKRKVYYALVK